MYVNAVEQKTEQKANITPIVFFEVDGWSKFQLKIPASHNTRENLCFVVYLKISVMLDAFKEKEAWN